MKRIALLLLLAVTVSAEDLRVNAGAAATVQPWGITAAYSLDPLIADVAYRDGTLTVYGRGAGETDVILVTPSGTRSMHVVVAAIASAVPRAKAPSATASIESRYSSNSRQNQNTITSVEKHGDRETTIQVVNVNRGKATLPSASVSIKTPARQLTFLDANVDNSPLTLSSTTLRGIHLATRGWELHAGVTGPTFYDASILPVRRELVFGVSRTWPLTPVTRIVSSVYLFPTRNANDPNRRGGVASVMLDSAPDEQTHIRTELAFSRGVGGAFLLDRARGDRRLRVDVRYQPRDFATAGPSTLRGFYSEASASTRVGSLSATANASFNDSIFPSFEQRTASATLDLRYRLTTPLTLIAGANYGTYRGVVPATETIRSLTIPIGASFDAAHFGVSAIARVNANSDRGDARGWRVSARTSFGAFRASAYIDQQFDSPSLELIVRERPDLALALEELGLTAESPADLARLLRDNASLINLGFIEGVTVNLAPRRTQAGCDFTWSGTRQQLRLRLLRNEVEGVSSRTLTSIAMLTWSRAVTARTRVEATVASWRTSSESHPFVDVAVRHTLDGLPHFGGSINGLVMNDDQRGAEGVSVQLDADRTTTTDANGRFAFGSVASGSHQVTAYLPSRDAYFTTSSRIEATPGDRVSFGIAHSPARISGRVITDASGVASVRIVLARGSERAVATTLSDGSYSLAIAPGAWNASLDRDSLPPGYESLAEAHDLQLARATMTTLDFPVKANRTISGRVEPAKATSLRVQPLGLDVPVDAQGHFAIRSLPAGRVTLVTPGAQTTVDLPDGPAAISGVVICSNCGR